MIQADSLEIMVPCQFPNDFSNYCGKTGNEFCSMFSFFIGNPVGLWGVSFILCKSMENGIVLGSLSCRIYKVDKYVAFF